ERALYETLFRSKERMESLEPSRRLALETHYRQLLEEQNSGAWSRLKLGASNFTLLPLSCLIWLVLSYVGGIGILKERKWNGYVALLLPLLAFLALLNAHNESYSRSPPGDVFLYPSEDYLVKHHLDGPLSRSISGQYDQLKEAWQRYLIANWSRDTPPTLMSGEWEFLLARIEARNHSKADSIENGNYTAVGWFISLFWGLMVGFTELIELIQRARSKRCA
ncbi:MAG: hypothetical protein KDK40_00685, partial [Chlamydiia bacterium]|nr:hypothetical protein [Chlamydiia bacterium]